MALENESIKDSAYILIGRAVEVYKGKSNRNQDNFVKELLNDTTVKKHGFSERTINGILSDANKKLADHRKK